MLSSIWRPAKVGKPAVELKDHSPEGVSLHLEDWCPPFGLPPLLPERPRSSNAWRRDPSLSGGSSRNVPDVDAELNPIDTTQWFPKVMRRDFIVGLTLTPGFVDDPDPTFYANYVCGAEANYNGYCNPELDKLVDQQSTEADIQKRKKLVWEIERKLAEDGARPIIFYGRGATCRQPYVKGLTLAANSIFNGWRMEDVWLDN